MKLQSKIEIENTQRKLRALEESMAAKESETEVPASREFALRNMKLLAQKLRAEIEEYARSQQNGSNDPLQTRIVG